MVHVGAGRCFRLLQVRLDLSPEVAEPYIRQRIPPLDASLQRSMPFEDFPHRLDPRAEEWPREGGRGSGLLRLRCCIGSAGQTQNDLIPGEAQRSSCDSR